ncbi:unnamed protein product [Aureobasidium vineae]|uniref:Ankyrin repeat protein n=1 Tax=Aureobasidium vineae TaxID=2773715 RepID=A0A9N8J7V8_9PEZI|nr:unnamed protein product [Aureobasidium vineae]
MAEIFGAVASGIGIAGVAAQAIDGIRKLQAFCNDIRDAPEEIKYLTNELEILLGTIAGIEAQIQRNASMCQNMNPTPALRFVDQSVRSLNAVIEKLNAEIAQKGTLGSMTMAWKRKILDAQGLMIVAELYLQTAMRTDTKVDQLSGSVTTLTNFCHTRPMATLQPQINASQQTGRGQQFPIVDDSHSREGVRKRPRSPKMVSALSFSLVLPHWLAQLSLQINVCRAARSWTVTLRSYRTITRDSKIWEAIGYGDFDCVRGLIESGQATMFDRDEFGWTFLHLAISTSPNNHEALLRIGRFSIDHGADPSNSQSQQEKHL